MSALTIFERDALRIDDYRCTAGPGDAPYPEQHGHYDLAYVRRGSFGYHTRGADRKSVV